VRSSNPAFATGAFQQSAYAAPGTLTMTVQGTVSKTFLLLAILSATAIWSWSEVANGTMTSGLFFGSLVVGGIVGLVTCFKPTWAPWTAPVYAAVQGVFLGAISMFFARTAYPGIALQAVGLTCGTLFVMLTLYGTRVIQVTDKLRMGIAGAMGALLLFYLVTWILRLCGIEMPAVFNSGPIGILFSMFVVGLAAFNLLLDFDMIEEGSTQGAPKTMEWFGAFALVMTLIWLYVQLLDLLRKINNQR
jgi:uncharacterized YccA/Bax inhibitor family protein